MKLSVSRPFEDPANRLQGVQSQRQFLTEMAFCQWPQSGEMIRPVVVRFTPDQVVPRQDMTGQE